MEQVEIESMEELFCQIVEKGDEKFFISRSRRGIFSPALVMWLEICSRVNGRKSLMSALSSLHRGDASAVCKLNSVSKPLKFGNVSKNNSGLCRARKRLALDAVESLCKLLAEELLKRSGEDLLWKGHRVYVMDGTVFSLSQSKSNFGTYPPVKIQNMECKTGQLLCACVHDLFTGIALSPAFGAYTGEKSIGETRLGKMLLQRLYVPGVIMADRGFGVFSTAWTARTHGHEVLLRLRAPMAKSICQHRIDPYEDFDKEVIWTAKTLTHHPEIPSNASVSGRVVQRIITREGFEPLTLTFFTTLREPVEELVKLYQKRERIENDIRSLKYTLEMELLQAKSPEVIEKELLLGFAASNLVRAIVAKAAQKLKLPARQISFSSALQLVQAFGNRLRDATDPSGRKHLVQEFLTGLRQTRLPNRKKERLEPRKIVRTRKQFPYMKKSREEERKIAEEVAKKHGHRGFFSTVSRIS